MPNIETPNPGQTSEQAPELAAHERPRHQRVPIAHPDYRYPESRNPYSEKIRSIPGWAYTDHDAERFGGRWREQFRDQAERGPGRKLHVEIGCNAGHVTVEWAKRNPADAYIGIDWKFKIIYRAAEKAQKRDLKNLIFLREHADRLAYIFGSHEIDALYLFFPDPWPKRVHQKNRYVNPANLRMIHGLVKKGGVFHIKTDHAGYFDWMLSAAHEVKDLWEVTELTRDLHAGNPAPEKLEIPDVTLFEKLFIKDRLPIHSVKLTPRHTAP